AGAGIGSNTRLLCNSSFRRWVCLEPDANLADRLSSIIKSDERLAQCEVINGRINDIPACESFDTILYLDVLEHIENDRAEIDHAIERLIPGGTIIILSPAHSCLFSAFDSAIGHYRRYNEKMLRELVPAHLELLNMEYLDSFGLLASLGNRYILKSQIPSKIQIKIWDSLQIPCSRILDKFLGYRLGKSILAVWRYLG
ncbi:class I SAM-dependent methyltransferase, partial [Thermodesulfobacteriota bacterium]